MAQHSDFLDRMNRRLDQVELQVGELPADTRRDMEASLRVQRDRLAELRRMGADVTAEATQSFAAAVERLALRVGDAMRAAA